MQHNEGIKIKATLLKQYENNRQASSKIAAKVAKNAQAQDRAKVASETGHYSPKASKARDAVQNGSPKPQPAIQLATFSTSELADSSKDKKKKEAHDELLRKELAKFRSEIEVKYKKSIINHGYQFPRNKTSTSSRSSSSDDDITENEKINRIHKHNTNNYS